MSSIGQRTWVETTGTAFPSQPADWVWGYDALGQVISADSPNSAFDRAYTYDQIGNRKKSADGTLETTGTSALVYESNDLNQYDAIGAFAPTYDADGNQKDAQILSLGSSSLVSFVYHWDAENRLVAVKDTNGADIVTYSYDSQSRRVARVQGSGVTLYLYDGWNCLAEYTLHNSSFNLQTSLSWGLDLSGSFQGAGGVGGLLSVTKHEAQSTTHYFPTYDGNGNISEYLTTTGSIAAHYEYDPFGRTIVASGDNAGDFAYRFSTKPVDAATGLYYYGYRWYDSENGRWINRDPIEERGGVNLYGFLQNRVIDLVDLLGLLDTGKCEVVYFVGHNDEVPGALEKWNNSRVHPSRASGNGCFIDGSNPKFGIGNGFVGASEMGIGYANYCGGEGGNGGFNPKAPDSEKNRAIGCIRLLQNNWLATLRNAEALADNCTDCDCVTITAKLVFTSDTPKYKGQQKTGFGITSTKNSLRISGLVPGRIENLRNLARPGPVTNTPTVTMSVTFNCAKTKESEKQRIGEAANRRRTAG